MNSDLERMLWQSAKENTEYPRSVWLSIIDDLLDDFERFIGEPFTRDAGDILIETSPPLFGRWIWATQESRGPLSTTWTGVIGGDSGVTAEGEPVFGVSLSLFLYHADTNERLTTAKGKSFLEFEFQASAGSPGRWRSLGWLEDIYGEWEDDAN